MSKLNKQDSNKAELVKKLTDIADQSWVSTENPSKGLRETVRKLDKLVQELEDE